MTSLIYDLLALLHRKLRGMEGEAEKEGQGRKRRGEDNEPGADLGVDDASPKRLKQEPADEVGPSSAAPPPTQQGVATGGASQEGDAQRLEWALRKIEELRQMAQEKEERIARLESTNRDLRQQLQVVGYEPAETMEGPRDEEEGTLKRRRKRKRRNRRKQPEHSKRNKNESCSTTETELDDEKGVAAPPLLVKQEVVEETTTTTRESAGTHVEVDQAQRENDEVLEARLEPKEKEKDELCVEEKQQGQEQQADQEAQVAGEASEVVRMLQDMFPGTSAQVIEHTLGEVAGSTEKAIDCLLNLCTALDLTRAESEGARPNIAPSSAAPTSTSTSTSTSSSSFSFTTPSISSTRSAHVSSPSRQSPRPVPSFSSSSSSSSSSSAPITYTRASSSVLGEPDEDAGVTCLSEQQQRALDLAERGYSMFLTGSAGTGKSFLLRQMIERLRLKHGPEAVAVTASTGT
jgi:hypothetical protein